MAFEPDTPIDASPSPSGSDTAVSGATPARSARPESATTGPRRPGAVILARHGEPALSRRVRLNADGYRRWWAAYEEGGILPGQTPPPALVEAAAGAHVVRVSTRRRAIETARAVLCGRDFSLDPVLIEAPLPPPPFPAFLRLKPRTWGFVSRFCWWWFDHHAGEESQRQATARARAVADDLIARAGAGGDVMVFAHGFFNAMVGRELKRRGWRLSSNGGFGYWSARRYTAG